MVLEHLDVPSILKTCKDEYRTLLDDGKWPAAAHAQDSRAIRRGYGNVNSAEAKYFKDLIANALIQNGVSPNRDKSGDCCRNCGGLGHWATDPQCPKAGQTSSRQPSQGGRSGRGRPGQGRNSSGRNGRGGRGRGPILSGRNGPRRPPRFPPPRNGESEIKTAEGGKKYYWCAKCNNWTISHGTETHKTCEELRTMMAITSIQSPSGQNYQFGTHDVNYMVISTPCKPMSMAVSANSYRRPSVLFDSGANCCITNDFDKM